MKTDKHQRKYLKDYQPPDFTIDETHLVFRLDAEHTRVESRLVLRRLTSDKSAPLRLDGIDLELKRLRLDGEILAPEESLCTNTLHWRR